MLICKTPEYLRQGVEAHKATTDEMLAELRERSEYQDLKVLTDLIKQMRQFGIKFDNAVRILFKFERGTAFQWVIQ